MALILAVFAALVVVDELLGLTYRTGTSATVTIVAPRSGTTNRAIVVFPGYIMPGDTLSRAFAPYVANDDAMVVVSYAERGVNVAQIFSMVIAALRTLKPVELRIYGASMGGMLSKLFLDDYRRVGAPYGKVTLILDTAPASRHSVKRPSLLLRLACYYRGGPFFERSMGRCQLVRDQASD